MKKTPRAVASGRRKEGNGEPRGRAAPRKPTAPPTVSRPELLVNGSDRTFRQLVDNFFAFAARHEAIRAGHAALIGLSGVEYSVLIAIRHLEDEEDVSVKRLAEHLHVSGAFATTVVGKLAARGVVAKHVEFGPLSAAEFRLLLDLLERLIAAGDQAMALQSYLALKAA
jgi:DNA-binding MarR family transcriptional regulator